MSDQLIFETGFFMSPNDIFDNERLDTKEKLVYLYLCRCSNNGSAAFPSYSTIGKKCSISRRSAIDAVNGLVEKEVVKRVGRADQSGSKTNVYRITARGANSAPGAGNAPPSADIAPGVVQNLHPPSADSAPNKELSIKNHSYKELKKEYMHIEDLDQIRITKEEYEKLFELMKTEEIVHDYLYKFAAWIITQAPAKQKKASAYLSARNWYTRDTKEAGASGRNGKGDRGGSSTGSGGSEFEFLREQERREREKLRVSEVQGPDGLF